MPYTHDTAIKQAAALLEAAKASPVRQFRYELHRRGLEWKRAAVELEGAADNDAVDSEVVIELAGSVTPGMAIPAHSGWTTVVRTMNRDGQFSIHIEDGDGRPQYLNLAGPASPVVVQA